MWNEDYSLSKALIMHGRIEHIARNIKYDGTGCLNIQIVSIGAAETQLGSKDLHHD